MKAFIYPADGFVGRILGPALVKQGYEVIGGTTSQDAPEYVSTSYQIDGDEDGSAARQLLLTTDVVVYHAPGNEKVVRDAVVLLAQQPYGGRKQTIICVTTPLSWATTRPAELLEPWSGGGGPMATGAESSAPPTADGLTTPEPPQSQPQPQPPTPQQQQQQQNSQPPQSSTAASTAAAGAGESAAELSASSAAATAGMLSDKDVQRRSCGAAGRAALELENLVLRSARKGRLATYVVCPGLLYGCGEDDALFHPLFRTSWYGSGSLIVYGSGNNRLPMIHVADLAAYLVAVAQSPPEQQYLLAVDKGGSTQGEVMGAIAAAMGNNGKQCEIRSVPKQELLLMGGNDEFKLDLQLVASPVPSYSPTFDSGLIANMAAVVQQYVTFRGLTPLRILLLGPPYAGKSKLAARLSKLYGLRHLPTKELLDSAAGADPDLAKALAAEMSGKEPRASNKTLAALLRHAAAQQSNRGFILDGFPRSIAQAKHAFMRVEPMSPEEVAQADKEAELHGRHTPTGKNKKDDAKNKKPVAVPVGMDEPTVPPGFKLVADPTVFPTHVFALHSSDADLRQRLAQVAAAEAEAAAALAAAAKAVDKGARAAKPDPALKTHNNEKDFLRRLEVYNAAQREDEEDLQKKVLTAQLLWDVHQAEAAEQAARDLAEANTYKAKRRRARALAVARALGGAAEDDPGSPGAAGKLLPEGEEAASAADDAANGGSGGGAADGAAGAPGGKQPTSPQVPRPAVSPVLPQYGGLYGLLASEGTCVLAVANHTAKPSPDAGALPAPNASPVAAVEAAVCKVLGPPHNFEGFPDETPPPPESTDDGGAAEAAAAAAAAAEREARMAQMAVLEQAAKRDHDVAYSQHTSHVGLPLRQYLMRDVMVPLTSMLVSLARERPADPLEVLIYSLRSEADRVEAQYVDPYTNDVYEIQAQKHVAKAERDAAREAFAVAKMEREAAARAEQQHRLAEEAPPPAA